MKILKQTGHSFLLLLFGGLVVYAVTNPIDLFNSGDVLDRDRINELVNKVNYLEQQNETQQNQIDNIVISGGNTYALKEIKTIESTDWQTWTISDLTIGKPLIIGVDGSYGGDIVDRISFRVISGCDFGIGNDTYYFGLSNASMGSYTSQTGPSAILVPSAETVEIKIKIIDSGRLARLYVYN